MADPDPLDDLRAQVRATQEAAQRLIDDAVPPGGWEVPRERASAFGEEVEQLASLLTTLREMLPPDLRDQVSELVRQLLLVLRALIDFAVTTLEEQQQASKPRPAGGTPVEDIPIS